MKPSEIRGLAPAELSKQLEEAHKELFNLRFRLATRQLVNVSEIGKVRKKIAQFKTIIRQDELAKESKESKE